MEERNSFTTPYYKPKVPRHSYPVRKGSNKNFNSANSNRSISDRIVGISSSEDSGGGIESMNNSDGRKNTEQLLPLPGVEVSLATSDAISLIDTNSNETGAMASVTENNITPNITPVVAAPAPAPAAAATASATASATTTPASATAAATTTAGAASMARPATSRPRQFSLPVVAGGGKYASAPQLYTTTNIHALTPHNNKSPLEEPTSAATIASASIAAAEDSRMISQPSDYSIVTTTTATHSSNHHPFESQNDEIERRKLEQQQQVQRQRQGQGQGHPIQGQRQIQQKQQRQGSRPTQNYNNIQLKGGPHHSYSTNYLYSNHNHHNKSHSNTHSGNGSGNDSKERQLRRPKLRVSMYNFGSPRVGNGAFAQLFNRLIPDSFRVVVDGDIVTGVPPAGYRHIGTQALIDNLGSGSIIMDPSFVERRLRTHTKTSVSVHSLLVYRKVQKKSLPPYAPFLP
jgi:hypothetical protein